MCIYCSIHTFFVHHGHIFNKQQKRAAGNIGQQGQDWKGGMKRKVDGFRMDPPPPLPKCCNGNPEK